MGTSRTRKQTTTNRSSMQQEHESAGGSQYSMATVMDRCISDYSGLAIATTFAFGVGVGLLLTQPTASRIPARRRGYIAMSRDQAEDVAHRVLQGLSQVLPEAARRRLHM
jgi:hypothetical protein